MEKVFQGLVVTSPAVQVEPAHPIIPVSTPSPSNVLLPGHVSKCAAFTVYSCLHIDFPACCCISKSLLNSLLRHCRCWLLYCQFLLQDFSSEAHVKHQQLSVETQQPWLRSTQILWFILVMFVCGQALKFFAWVAIWWGIWRWWTPLSLFSMEQMIRLQIRMVPRNCTSKLLHNTRHSTCTKGYCMICYLSQRRRP